MKVAIVGGVYGKNRGTEESGRVTAEMLLENGLRELGVEVDTYSHFAAFKHGNYDVIHVHHLGWGALRAALDKSNAAFVFTTHKPFFVPTGQAIKADALSRRADWSMRFSVGSADAMVSLSSAEKAYLEANYHVKGAVSTVIPCGIDTDWYKRERANHAGRRGPWEILYVGQLNRIKRVDLLLRAVSKTKHNVVLRLVFYNNELEQTLRELAAELGITDKVDFVGLTRREELNSYYNRADVYVLPSSFEALPAVITEAMTCGTPVIATDVGGVREQMNHFGLLVPPNDDLALTGALNEMFDNYDRYYADSERMSEYALQNFSVKAMVDRHIALYQSLGGQNGRRRQRRDRAVGNLVARAGMALYKAKANRSRM